MKSIASCTVRIFVMHRKTLNSMMEKFKLAAELDTSVSLSDRVGTLYKACQTLAGFSRSWCPIEKLEAISVPPPEGVTAGSEEHNQLTRAVLRADDIASALSKQIDGINTGLDLSQLVNLYWCLAILGRYEENMVRTVQRRVHELLNPGVTIENVCKLLFSESTFFHRESSINISFDEETFAGLSLPVQANLLQSLALMRKDVEMALRLKKILLSNTMSMIKQNLDIDKEVIPYVARVCLFVGALVGQDNHHDVSRLRSALSPSRLPAWKYSFELCLACHAVATKGVELNPFIENVFPTDTLYIPPKGKKKLIVELVRPNSVVWTINGDDVTVYGVDCYTRLTRLTLAYLGYRIVAITLTEWLKLRGDKARQVSYVKRRIRNCLRQRRLFSGTERDVLRSGSELSEESSDSDMSY